ncbi:MAG: UDP-N-acetylmuramoyl-L-alanyl-D-glutamate--2,6-diaminopimelate ligase [Candidatus Sedimenticola endophacoides]
MAARRIDPQGMALSRLLSGLAVVAAGEERTVRGLTLDSRRLAPGDLFLACAGTRHHGMAFAEQAIRAGAAAILYEPDSEWFPERIEAKGYAARLPVIAVEGLGRRVSALAGTFFGHPSRALRLVGVTGTNGKTSCSQFLAQALEGDHRCGVIGTLGNGFPGALEPGAHTTPDPVELQALLRGMLEAGAESVAMEVSSHALDQGRAEDLRFDIALFTNLSRDHLDYHGSMAAYGASKRRLFQMPGLKAAVLNLDDPFGRGLLRDLSPEVEAVGYGLDPSGAAGVGRWVAAGRVDASLDGMRIAIHGSWGEGTLHTPLLGRFNVSNLLAVLAVLLYRGIPLKEALSRLGRVRTAAGRMEAFGGHGQPLVVVDFAHTPDALEQALRALRPHAGGRLVVLFGCGGDRDRGKRPEMGAVAERLADAVWISDDNPRCESGDAIVAGILSGLARPRAARVERDRGAAIRAAIAEAGEGDLILIAGKGHETHQQVGELKHPFSDRSVVTEALAGGGQ